MIKLAQCSIFATALAIGLAVGPLAQAQVINATLVVHFPNGTAPSFPVTGQTGMTVEQLMQRAKLKYTATFFPSVGGYALMQVQNVPPQTNGQFGSPFWWLCVNEVSAKLGMSAQTVMNGDEIE
jgi:hypothetical protein